MSYFSEGSKFSFTKVWGGGLGLKIKSNKDQIFSSRGSKLFYVAFLLKINAKLETDFRIEELAFLSGRLQYIKNFRITKNNSNL